MNWMRAFRVAYLVLITAAATFLCDHAVDEIVELVATARPWYLILSLFSLLVLVIHQFSILDDRLGRPWQPG